METLIGLDWSQQRHNICILNPHGAITAQFAIAHSPTGFAELEQRVTKLGVTPPACAVALETAHNLVVDFLWARQFQVYVIAPSVLSHSRGRYTTSGAHDDNRDAFILADLLRTDRNRFAPWQPDGALVRQLRAQLSLVDNLTKTIVAQQNRLAAILQRYYPAALHLFGDLTAQITLQFLSRYPSPQAAQSLTAADFVVFCQKQGYTHPKLVPECYAAFRQPVPEADSVIVLAYQDETCFVTQLLLTLVQQKAHLIREAQRLFAQHPDHAIFATLPGAGDLLAPQLLVLFGDHRERFPTAQAAQTLAGTCPVTRQSGKQRRVTFRHACNHDYRLTMQQFALASLRESEWTATYFQQCRARGHSKSQAYRCLANRWLAIIWHLWQTRQEYDEARHLQDIHRQRRP
ncbi:MAG TPA: IS110 family transposase [Hyphomicrobiaceae bacterium]|nr:IS110 family transposase [Hyphomicrobiaceae bacterium]